MEMYLFNALTFGVMLMTYWRISGRFSLVAQCGICVLMLLVCIFDVWGSDEQ
jgi:hypothetical protein